MRDPYGGQADVIWGLAAIVTSAGAITFEVYAARRHALDSPALQNSLSAKALAGRALIDATTVTQPSDTAPEASTPTVVDSDAEQQQLWEPPTQENDRTL